MRFSFEGIASRAEICDLQVVAPPRRGQRRFRIRGGAKLCLLAHDTLRIDLVHTVDQNVAASCCYKELLYFLFLMGEKTHVYRRIL